MILFNRELGERSDFFGAHLLKIGEPARATSFYLKLYPHCRLPRIMQCGAEHSQRRPSSAALSNNQE